MSAPPTSPWRRLINAHRERSSGRFQWNAVRDGLLDPRRFIASITGAVPETEPAIRDRLLLFVAEALSSLPARKCHAESHDQVLATTIRLAKESVASDADAWRAYTRVHR